jgi:hypothetical protein
MESYGFFTNSWLVRPVRKPSRKVRRSLAGIMFVESVLVFVLALRDFALVATPTISFVALPAISGVGFTTPTTPSARAYRRRGRQMIPDSPLRSPNLSINRFPVASSVKEFFCREIRLKPRNVIHELVGDSARFEVFAIFKDPTNPSLQPPALILWSGVNGNYLLNSSQWKKVSAANPTLVYTNIGAEYSPSEQSATPGGGTPSTTQPPSTSQPPSNTQPR